MAKVTVSAERAMGAPPATVYACLADMHHRPAFLPPAFSGFEVEEGGVGTGTVVRFTVTAGGRARQYRMAVAETEPGRVLTETDTGSSLVTTFTVTPDSAGSRVRIDTAWDGAGGVGGFFERRFAPRVLRGIYQDELGRLDAYLTGRDGPA
jgi:uncharacterized protein YndB with AHSA1/START domain